MMGFVLFCRSEANNDFSNQESNSKQYTREYTKQYSKEYSKQFSEQPLIYNKQTNSNLKDTNGYFINQTSSFSSRIQCEDHPYRKKNSIKQSNKSNKSRDSESSKDSENSGGSDSDSDDSKDKEDTDPCEEKKEEPPKCGNFAVVGKDKSTPSAARTPGALISFGQNIVDKNELLVDYGFFDFFGKHSYFLTEIPYFVYGITDKFSLTGFFYFGVNKSFEAQSAGVEDWLLQLEYAIYEDSNKEFVDLGTIVGGYFIPTGTTRKNPTTGNGAPAFFIGTTFGRTYVEWLFFSCLGTTFTTEDNDFKAGNIFLYQFGLGKHICVIKKRYVFDIILEADGYFTTKTRINGLYQPDTGGNVVYLTPSIWISTDEYIIQFGVGVPIAQRVNGNQDKIRYLVAGILTYVF